MTSFNQWIEVDGCGTMPTSLIFAMENLTIEATNVFPPLANTPSGGLMTLVVNNSTFTPDDGPDGSFTLSGNQITWTSPAFSVNPGDVVVAIYSYQG